MSAATMQDSVVFGSLWSQSSVHALFAEIPRTRAWLEIVAVLAEVQSEFDLIPAAAAQAIAVCCRSLTVDAALLEEFRAGREASGHSMQGLIRLVQTRLEPQHAQWVYVGATVQDVTDTWTMQVLREVHHGLEKQLATLDRVLATLAARHRDTVMVGRTHGQQGLPITFGYKVAVWLVELRRHRQRLMEVGSRSQTAQLCGGVGSVASLGPQGLAVQARFAQRLGLKAPAISWTNSRDVYAEWGNLLTLLSGTADRIGHEVYNLQRGEISELREGLVPGTVGSITMPHKRNPEIAEHLGTLARLTRHLAAALNEGLVQDHERDGRAWKTEWHALPEATMMTTRALELLLTMLEGLEVDALRMRANAESTGGFVLSEAFMLALAPMLGRDSAHRLLYQLSLDAQACGQTFAQGVRADATISAHLAAPDVDALLDLGRHTGQCAAMVDRVLADLA